MELIDAQLHDPAPYRDWTGFGTRIRHDILTELVLSYLDSLGISGAILVPGDSEWVTTAAREQPSRLACILRIDPNHPDIDGFVAGAKAKYSDGLLALRASIGWPLDGSQVKRFEDGAWEPAFTACEKYHLPVFLFIAGWLPLAAPLAERHPELTLIIDHLGLRQPPLDQPDSPPFKSLPDLLALARFPNVAVKLCGLPALSDQPFPHADVVPRLRSIVDAFGADRVMWASDISRFYGRIGLRGHEYPGATVPYPGKHTYAESLNFVRYCDELTSDEKEAILGGTVRRMFGWPSRPPESRF